MRDKIALARGMAQLVWARDDAPNEAFADWLTRHHQTEGAIKFFWTPILVSTLNERLEQMDVGHAHRVMLDGFLRNRTGFELEIPLVPLGELYGNRLESWLAEREVTVRLTAGVAAIEEDADGAIGGVRLRSGERLAGDFVVLAVPFDRVVALVPESLRARLPMLGDLSRLKTSPITGVHLWFDRSVCPFDHVVTPGRLIQWVFNHTRIQGRRASPADSERGAGEYLQVVISASYDLLALDKSAIRDAVLAELRDLAGGR